MHISKAFTLIEVLISLFIITSFFVLILDFQINALKRSQVMRYCALAELQLDNIYERLRGNSSEMMQLSECEQWKVETNGINHEFKSKCQCSSHICNISLKYHNFIFNEEVIF